MSLCIFSVPFISLTKAKAYNTYKAPQAAHRSCSGAFVSQTEPANSL